MTLEEERRKLHDGTFLLGRFRRLSAIRELTASSDPASAVVLAEALIRGHPDTARIDAALRQLSAERDTAKVRALWELWAQVPNAPVASILVHLGWPSDRGVQAETVRDILAAAHQDAAPEILRAVAVFARSLPLAEDQINDVLCGAWVRSRSVELGQLIVEQGRQPGTPAAAIALAQALDSNHPDAARIDAVLRQLTAEHDTGKVLALWGHWAQAPTVRVAAILAHLGWPPSCAAQARTTRDILAAAHQDAAPEILQAVTLFARSLTVTDEEINDAIYAAWVRSQSGDLEQLITEQERQPGNPVLEALHALVAGRLQRYAALHDESGHLLIQSYAMAPEPLRERLARAVAASHDRRIKAAYREALAGSGADATRSVDNLRLVADEDGLFESCRSLRLMQVLDLCERWSDIAARPGGVSQRAAVDRAVAAYRRLKGIKAESGPALPPGMLDIFDGWRVQEPDDAQLRSDLEADDPFVKARGLYLGYKRGIADASRIAAAAASAHWPERLIARLVDLAFCAQPGEDHVFWASAFACDAALLNAPVGGTPEEYARHTALLAAGKLDVRNLGLLEILCAFQEVFVGAGITVDTGAEATDHHAIEVEDAPDEVF
ncbi:hypothetical protein [Candidatus Ferrigenium straubiae]|uniref:hypothetical protein n=1 Tax=Candidatus Ferrigenium straubiae TaxID=2919506 RepID=UPI003F4AB404